MNSGKQILLYTKEGGLDEMSFANGLSLYGYTIEMADTRQAVEKQCKTDNKPDLILLDIDPGAVKDNFKTAKLLIKDLDIPVVFLVEKINKNIEKHLSMSPYGYILKNTDAATLYNTVSLVFKLYHEKRESAEKNRQLKNYKETLSDFKERLNLTLEDQVQEFWEWDLKSNTIKLGEKWKKSTGHTDTEATSFIDIMKKSILPADYDNISKQMNAYLNNETPIYKAEYHLQTTQGEWIWVLDKGKIIKRDSKGKPVKMYGTHTYIADDKRIQDSFYTIYNFFTNGPVMLMIYDLYNKNSIRYLSPNVENILGYSVKELTAPGFKLSSIIHPDDLPLLLETHSSFNKNTSQVEQSYRIKHKNGEYLWLYSYTKQLRNSKGIVTETHGYIFNQTKLKEIERDLQSQKQRLSGILQSTNVATWEWNVQTGETIFNERWAELLGYSLEELSPTTIDTWYSVAHPDDLKKSNELMKKHFNGESDFFDIECRMRHKKGHYVYVHARGKLVSWTVDGKPLWMFGAHSDITQRRQMEKLLDQTRRNYLDFFNTIPDFIFVLDKQGKIIHVNQAVLERIGYTREELLGNPIMMVLPVERREEVENLLPDMAKGLVEYCPVPIQTKDGSLIHVETKVATGKWDNKFAIFTISKDISRIKMSEEKFSKVFYVNPSACALSDLDTGELIEVNDAFTTLLGYKKNEAIGKSVVDLGIMDATERQGIVNFGDKQSKYHNIDCTLLTKNGQKKHVLVSAVNIYVQDKLYRYNIANDVTELKENEKRIQALLEEKQIILKEVHHRIKNHMVFLMSLLRFQKGKLDDPSAISALEDAETRISSMMVLYDKLYVSQNFQQVSTKYYISALVDEIAKNFKDIQHITIQKDIADITMSTKILQPLGIIINELLTNIFKYAFINMDDGAININTKVQDNNFTIVIQDNGAGLPQNINFENTEGFGLKLVGILTKQIDGKIDIERENGTCITLEFPL